MYTHTHVCVFVLQFQTKLDLGPGGTVVLPLEDVAQLCCNAESGFGRCSTSSVAQIPDS